MTTRKHLGEMDPSITPRMPVLNSPLLSIHVSIIMISYALFSLTFICAIAYFLTYRSKKANIIQTNKQLTTLSQIFLYPRPFFYNHSRIRNFYRSNMGKHQLGYLLGMGSKGNMGTYNVNGIRYSAP